jgi:membrane protein YqaA with SNARE-associated domain
MQARPCFIRRTRWLQRAEGETLDVMTESARALRPPSRAQRLLALADRPAGVAVLVVLALLEATVFPGPTEAMLVALTLARRERAFKLATIATVASVAGGVAGYFLGATLFADVVQPLLASYGLSTHVDTVARVYEENMLIALATSGYTPIPYMLYTSLAGAAHLSLPVFVVGSFLGRALKYVPIAGLAYLLGPRVQQVLGRYGAVAGAIVVLVLLVWILY